jgi:hypothetical protein
MYNPFNSSAALDYYLYFDEDHDLDEDEMTEYTPVEAVHLIELIERGLVAAGEVFSHRGWHHCLDRVNDKWHGSMWDGPTGEERRYYADTNEWDL